MGAGTIQPGEEKAQRRSHQCLRGEYKEARARSFPMIGPEAMGTSDTQDILLNVRKYFFTVRVSEYWSRLSREFCGLSIKGDLQKLSGRGPEELAVGGPV